MVPTYSNRSTTHPPFTPHIRSRLRFSTIRTETPSVTTSNDGSDILSDTSSLSLSPEPIVPHPGESVKSFDGGGADGPAQGLPPVGAQEVFPSCGHASAPYSSPTADQCAEAKHGPKTATKNYAAAANEDFPTNDPSAVLARFPTGSVNHTAPASHVAETQPCAPHTSSPIPLSQLLKVMQAATAVLALKHPQAAKNNSPRPESSKTINPGGLPKKGPPTKLKADSPCQDQASKRQQPRKRARTTRDGASGKAPSQEDIAQAAVGLLLLAKAPLLVASIDGRRAVGTRKEMSEPTPSASLQAPPVDSATLQCSRVVESTPYSIMIPISTLLNPLLPSIPGAHDTRQRSPQSAPQLYWIGNERPPTVRPVECQRYENESWTQTFPVSPDSTPEPGIVDA